MTEFLSKKLSLRVRLGYGIGDTAICFYWSGVGFLLLYFYTDVVGISPIIAGSIFMIGMLWDAFTDPFMGYLAERTRTRWGVYRLIYCLVICHLLCLLFFCSGFLLLKDGC